MVLWGAAPPAEATLELVLGPEAGRALELEPAQLGPTELTRSLARQPAHEEIPR